VSRLALDDRLRARGRNEGDLHGASDEGAKEPLAHQELLVLAAKLLSLDLHGPSENWHWQRKQEANLDVGMCVLELCDPVGQLYNVFLLAGAELLRSIARPRHPEKKKTE